VAAISGREGEDEEAAELPYRLSLGMITPQVIEDDRDIRLCDLGLFEHADEKPFPGRADLWANQYHVNKVKLDR